MPPNFPPMTHIIKEKATLEAVASIAVLSQISKSVSLQFESCREGEATRAEETKPLKLKPLSFCPFPVFHH